MPQVQPPQEIDTNHAAISAQHTNSACHSPNQGVDPPHNIHTSTRFHKRRRIYNTRLIRESGSPTTTRHIHLNDASDRHSSLDRSSSHRPPTLTPRHDVSASSAYSCTQPQPQHPGSIPLTATGGSFEDNSRPGRIERGASGSTSAPLSNPTTGSSNSPVRKKPRLKNRPLGASSVGPVDHSNLPVANCPFMLGYKGAFWNSQALLAAAPDKAASKQRTAWNIFKNVDFMGLAETHSTKGHVKVLSVPKDTKFFWSHYETRWRAGVGIGVKHEFLKLFNPTTEKSIQHIQQGRALKLSLEGPNGNLHIIVVYGHAKLEERERRDERCTRKSEPALRLRRIP